MPEKSATIRQKVYIAAEPKEVYDCFVSEKKHSQFTGSIATISNKIGGKFTAWDGYIFGKNIVLDKGKRIVQEWQTTEWPSNCPPSRVEFSFRKKCPGTEIAMVHSQVPRSQAPSYKQGWKDFYWKPLKGYFAAAKPATKLK